MKNELILSLLTIISVIQIVYLYTKIEKQKLEIKQLKTNANWSLKDMIDLFKCIEDGAVKVEEYRTAQMAKDNIFLLEKTLDLQKMREQ